MKESIHQINYRKFNNNDLNEVEESLFRHAVNARINAHAPYSEFLVGCAIFLENGTVVTGNNQENAAYPSGTCAERTAIFYAHSQFPAEKIKTIWILGGKANNNPDDSSNAQPVPPCGACRQVILEYENLQDKPIEIYFSNLKGDGIMLKSIKDLLPFSFGASYL